MLMEYEPKLSDTNMFGESFTLFSRGFGGNAPFLHHFPKKALNLRSASNSHKNGGRHRKKITFSKRPLEGRMEKLFS